jgi:hypothetical protein
MVSLFYSETKAAKHKSDDGRNPMCYFCTVSGSS